MLVVLGLLFSAVAVCLLASGDAGDAGSEGSVVSAGSAGFCW